MQPLTRCTRQRSVATLIPVLAIGVVLGGCGGTDRTLAPTPEPELGIAGTDGREGKLTFHSNRAGDDYDIFVMNADGTDQTQLTDNDTYEFEPAWSPNGKQIAFISFTPDFSGSDIWVINADGTGLTQVTRAPGYEGTPSWSPDGKRLAFSSNRDGLDDIYTVNIDGTGTTRVTTNAYVASVTAWSPNGKQIAFIGYRDYIFEPVGDLEIYTVNVDGTNITQLTDNTVDDEGDHAGWSPNGKLFSFSSRRDGGDLDIFVMNADGTNVRQVTGVGGDSADDDDSVWSPNGRFLAFQSTRDGDEEVYTSDLAGTDVRQLTHNVGPNDAVPGWASGRVHPDTPPGAGAP